jgi:hypothetical protein
MDFGRSSCHTLREQRLKAWLVQVTFSIYSRLDGQSNTGPGSCLQLRRVVPLRRTHL